MENFALFNQHVAGIHQAARIVIEKQQGSKAVWPALTLKDVDDEGLSIVEFAAPVILWNAPIRASSKATQTKRAIVMDGSFCFKKNIFDRGGASLEVYSVNRHQGGYDLHLLEAMHFDIEPHTQQSPFHPMFHVQFGKNHRWDLAALQSSVADLTKLSAGQVTIHRQLAVPTRDVRIPTPQMDYLSMLVMVIADYFCEKNSTHEVKAGFKNLLKKVMNPKNSARNGRQSIRLAQRWGTQDAQPFCASHWYEESCN